MVCGYAAPYTAECDATWLYIVAIKIIQPPNTDFQLFAMNKSNKRD